MLPLQNTPLTALSRNLKILEISEEEELLSVMHYFLPLVLILLLLLYFLRHDFHRGDSNNHNYARNEDDVPTSLCHYYSWYLYSDHV